VIQNHLLQVMSLLTMEPPATSSPECARDAKVAVLKAVRPLDPGDVVLGQYQGYREVKGVAADSKVETYAAVRLWIDDWRWTGVPFFIRSGKCLPVTATEVFVKLKPPPQDLFRDGAAPEPNHLRFRLEPEVSISLGARFKRPGEKLTGDEKELRAVAKADDDMPPYERLLSDAARGQTNNFTRQDGVEAAWEIVEPILGNKQQPDEYKRGTWGPKQAEQLLGGGQWYNPKASEGEDESE